MQFFSALIQDDIKDFKKILSVQQVKAEVSMWFLMFFSLLRRLSRDFSISHFSQL